LTKLIQYWYEEGEKNSKNRVATGHYIQKYCQRLIMKYSICIFNATAIKIANTREVNKRRDTPTPHPRAFDGNKQNFWSDPYSTEYEGVLITLHQA